MTLSRPLLPNGSKQQQITLYPHWTQQRLDNQEPYTTLIPDHFVPLTQLVWKLRFEHANTGKITLMTRRLQSVKETEASCYGYEGFGGDADDDFTVEICASQAPAPGKAQEDACTEPGFQD